MEDKIFIMEFEQSCYGGCRGDITVRLLKAKSYDEAYELTWKHRNQFYPNCPFSVREVVWELDNTAYAYYDYSNRDFTGIGNQ